MRAPIPVGRRIGRPVRHDSASRSFRGPKTSSTGRECGAIAQLVTAEWPVIQALLANRWSSLSVGRTLGFHPGCETILSASSIVMPSGRRQFRKSVCASDLNAWFDRNQRLTNERQESKNPKFKSSRRPPPPRELSWEPPSSWELSWEPPSSWELPWPVFS